MENRKSYMHESLKKGDIYLQSYEDDPPVVNSRNDKTIVRINDILTGKKRNVS